MSELFPPPTQGAKAVRSGRYGELSLEAAFQAHKVNIVNDNPGFHDSQLWKRKEKLLIRQFRLPTGRLVDFLYKDFPRDLSLPIECKQQMGSGTCDEKLAYTVDELAKSGYRAFWLVLSGGGFTPRVLEAVEKKILSLHGVKGRRIFNDGPWLQRAVERLVDKGEV